MEEQWKDIVIQKDGIIYDYSGLYQVSNLGRVKSLDRIDVSGRSLKGKILKLGINNKGYLYITLHKDGKRKNFLIHRLVAVMFIPNPDNLPVVNHLDENPSNDVWTNLEWCTQKHNAQYSSYKRKGKMVGDKNPMYGKPKSEEWKQRHSEKIKGELNPNAKKVICLETGQTFGCTKDAEKWCGKTGVDKCCRGITKSAGGLHWQYYEDYKKDLRKESDIKNTQLIA